MMKGFWHMIEIFIVVLVLLVLLFQFSQISRIGGDWSKSNLVLQGRDILNSLEYAGVNWFNETEVDSKLQFVFNDSNIMYNLKIRNTMKTEIQVACYCDVAAFSVLEKALKKFSLNTRNITFHTFRYDPGDLVFSNLYDVTVVNGTSIKGQLGPMIHYLSDDRGILLIKDLAGTDFAQIEEKSELENIFGLRDDSSASSPNNMYFNPNLNPNVRTYPLVRYFYSFPYFVGEIPQTFPKTPLHSFSNFIQGEAGIYPYNDDDVRKIIIDEDGYSGLIVNEGISEGRGRTAWLSDGITGDESDVILKDIVAWLGGESNDIVDNTLTEEVAVVSLMKLYNQDMYETVEIILTLSYFYENL